MSSGTTLLRVGTVLVTTAFASLLPSPVRADPVTLAGAISINTLEGPTFDLSGPGFRLVGAFGFTTILPEGSDFFQYCRGPGGGCLPGDTIQLSGETEDELFIGLSIFTLDGVRHEDVMAFISGRFDAPSGIVPPEADIVSVQAPFTFAGSLRITTQGGEQLFFTTASGHGTAHAALEWGNPTMGFYDDHQSITYVFAQDVPPVPEPATMILLGTGLAGIALRKRRR